VGAVLPHATQVRDSSSVMGTLKILTDCAVLRKAQETRLECHLTLLVHSGNATSANRQA
jgi:hypothetical protein